MITAEQFFETYCELHCRLESAPELQHLFIRNQIGAVLHCWEYLHLHKLPNGNVLKDATIHRSALQLPDGRYAARNGLSKELYYLEETDRGFIPTREQVNHNG